jgi:hypothetical protein
MPTVKMTAKKVTLDDVWAGFDRIQKTLEEVAQAHKETEKAQKETEKQLKETSRIVGDLGNRFGDIAEHFLTPSLRGKFDQFDFTFGEVSRNVEWEKKEHNLSMELDALLENGDQAMVVEVKAKLDKADVDEQINRMAKVRQYANFQGDKRQFYCAIATMVAKKSVVQYTLANGFYLIMPSGEDVKITQPTSKPRFW